MNLLARLLALFRRRPSRPASGWLLWHGMPMRDPTAAEIAEWQADSVREIAERRGGSGDRWLSPRRTRRW